MDFVLKAKQIATVAHATQFREQAGVPYIVHPLGVALKVRHLGPEYEAAAWLHDVVEDTSWTLAQLLAEGIPRNVVETVDALSHRDNEDYFDYVNRLMLNKMAIPIKIADVVYNFRDTLDTQPDKYYRMRKYTKALEILQNA